MRKLYRGMSLGAALLGWILFLGGCQVGNKSELPPPPPLTIKNIEAQPSQVNIVTTRAAEEPGAYIMGGPPRLVIEFKNADLAKEAPNSGQGTGDLIKSWSAEQKTISQQTPEGESRQLPVVRVTVELNKNITYKVTSSPTACIVDVEEVKKVEETSRPVNIEIPKEVYGQIQKLSVSSAGQPTGTVAVPLGPGDEKAAREMLSEIIPEKAKVEKYPPATTLDNITYKNENGVFTAIITGDGEFQNYKLLSLDPPLRVAVDFYSIKNNLGNKVFQVNSGRIRQIRVGSYPAKTRVVIELNGKTLKDARIVAMGKKMVMKIIY